jgi:hypothetical protein
MNINTCSKTLFFSLSHFYTIIPPLFAKMLIASLAIQEHVYHKDLLKYHTVTKNHMDYT